MKHSDQMKVVVLGTGGTIAGTAVNARDNIGYTAAQIGVAQLLRAIPGLPSALRGHVLVAEQVAQVDSKDMDFSVWQRLAARCAYWLDDTAVQGIVITHGTDTLEETAWFLQMVLQPCKPVVLTCAMRPSSALTPDGPQNLLDAVSVVLDGTAHGVVAVCAGVVHGAREVRKNHPYRMDAFDSGEGGPLGFIEEKVVRWVKNLPRPSVKRSKHAINIIASVVQSPHVEIVMNYAGASGTVVDFLVKEGVRGLVAAGTGNGSLHHDLEAALLRAQASGVRVVRATRCAQGQVLPLTSDVIDDSKGLSPVKARVALMLELLGASSRDV